MKRIAVFLLAMLTTVYSQTLTYHTYGPVKENNFETWQRLDLGTPLGGGNEHRFGAEAYTNYQSREYRNINFWTWSNDDIPKEATVYKVEINFNAGKSGTQQDMNISLHNISATYQQSGINFYNECKSDNKIFEESIAHTDWEAIFDKTFTSLYGSDVVNAINSAVQSGDYYFTLGIKCQGNMLNYPWHIGDVYPNGQPEIDLKIYYTTENHTITVKQKYSNNTEFGDVGVWETNTWESEASGYSYSFSVGDTEYLQAETVVSQNEKFNNWNTDLSFENYSSIYITDNLNDLTANFNGVSSTDVINSLESTNSYGGSVQLKDPWYRDSTDSKGTLNRGLSAIYHSCSNFDLSTSSSHQGVFLGQGYNPANQTWSPPYYSVKATSPQTIYMQGKNRQFYFQNWEANPIGSADFDTPNNLETKVVFNQADATVKAVMKGTQLSNDNVAFTHNNQRKTVRTYDGNLHMVYESMGHVWYEMSTDDGDNWTIMNGGQPIDSGCNLAKSPSIALDYSYSDNFFLVYQEVNYDAGQGLDEYVVVVKRFTSTGSESSVYSKAEVYESGLDMEPVIAANKYNLLVVYKVVDSEAPEGLNYILLSRSTENSFTYRTDGLISSTYSSSVHPTLVSSQINSSTGYYYLAWQQYPDIKFIKMSVVNNTSLSFGSTETPSYGSGNIYNYYPSVTADGNNVHLVWQGTKKVYTNTANKVFGPITYTYEKKVNYRKRDYLNNWGTFTLYGNDVGYPNINNASSAYMYCWSENNGVTNKFISSSYSGSQYFTTHGKDIQAINHTNYDNMRAVSFNNRTLPYFFTTTETVEDITLQKTESEIMKYGREGIVNINEGAFFFLIGDILLDEEDIDFVEITDTTQFANLDDFNSYLRTKPFQISSSNNLQMSVMFGAVNDSLVNNILEDDDFINFKMELVDSKTKEVLGIFDDVTYTKLKVEEYANISYELNTDGIGNREVEIRLLIEENIGAEYTLAKVFSDKEILLKSITKSISYQGSLEVTDYALSQNYPNPFNPSTTIKYQIPNDGMVSIKIYDITGQEVKTLVNQEQTKGRYEVNFDASNLSSGVYFYRINSGSFTKSMKMLLLK